MTKTFVGIPNQHPQQTMVQGTEIPDLSVFRRIELSAQLLG